jgi:hypothetical protein
MERSENVTSGFWIGLVRNGLSVLLILFLYAMPSLAQEVDGHVDSEKITPDHKTWVGFLGSWGRHHHIWSSSDYKGFRNRHFGLFMEWEDDPLKLLSVDMDRTWRVELRYAKLYGTFKIDDDQVVKERLVEGQQNWVTLDDHYSISLIGVRRWVFLPKQVIRPNVHLGFGFSVMNQSVIENGTIWHFNFVGGGGLEYDLNKKWTIYGDVRWEHFSNGGQIYLTNKDVIGPESINIVLGVRYLL